MQTQKPGTEHKEIQPEPSLAPRGRNRRLAGIGASLIVIVIIASSVIVFALVGLHGGKNNQGNPPSAGSWKVVNEGYLFLSIASSASNSSVLYACATTSGVVSSQSGPGTVTILRSIDSGASWQDVGGQGQVVQGANCQLAVNPTNSNEVYVFSGANTSQSPGVLKHSIDGGTSWQTIQPALFLGAHAQSLFLQQLQMVGGNLFAIDWNVGPLPTTAGAALAYYSPRLVRSTNGGHTWMWIDSQFASQYLGVQSYAIDPTNANTIYELLGLPGGPVQIVPPGGIMPNLGMDRELVKTTDGGSSWTIVLSRVPYGSQVQLAQNQPNIIYVGGIYQPIPLSAQPPHPTTPPLPSTQSTLPQSIGNLHLQVSSDGGAHWSTIANPPQQPGILNWFVDANGFIYVSPMMIFNPSGGTSATGVAGTPVVGTVVPMPPLPAVTPQNHGTPISFGEIAAPGGNLHLLTTPTPAPVNIARYSPTSKSWSQLTQVPASGILVAVTATGTGSTSSTALWFMGTSNGQYALYRYIV